jgi:hypothetical protein
MGRSVSADCVRLFDLTGGSEEDGPEFESENSGFPRVVLESDHG